MKAGDLVEYKNSAFGTRVALVLRVREFTSGAYKHYVDILWQGRKDVVCYAAEDLRVVNESR